MRRLRLPLAFVLLVLMTRTLDGVGAAGGTDLRLPRDEPFMLGRWAILLFQVARGDGARGVSSVSS